jgi:hypothetical protein
MIRGRQRIIRNADNKEYIVVGKNRKIIKNKRQFLKFSTTEKCLAH